MWDFQFELITIQQLSGVLKGPGYVGGRVQLSDRAGGREGLAYVQTPVSSLLGSGKGGMSVLFDLLLFFTFYCAGESLSFAAMLFVWSGSNYSYFFLSEMLDSYLLLGRRRFNSAAFQDSLTVTVVRYTVARPAVFGVIRLRAGTSTPS